MTERNRIPYQKAPHEPSDKVWIYARHGVEEKPVFQPTEQTKPERYGNLQISIFSAGGYQIRNSKDDTVESSVSYSETNIVISDKGGEIE